MSAKILITGGTGFLGSYILKELVEQGYSVRAIRRNTSKFPFYIPAEVFQKVEWVEGDVLDVVSLEDAMEGIDTVIHSAAIVSFHKRDRKHMYDINVNGTANVVNVALQKNIMRLVHISSIAAIGRTTHGGTVNEETKWQDSKANTHYAKSKYKAELEVWRAISEGLNAVILNPATILGYGDWHSTSCSIFKRVYDEFRWYSTGHNGFVDVEDVAKVVVMMMKSDISEQRFIVTAENLPFRTLQEMIADNFNRKKPNKAISVPLLNLALQIGNIGSVFTGNKNPLSRETIQLAFSKTYFENDKILKALPGFSFTPLSQTIDKACKKYLARMDKLHA